MDSTTIEALRRRLEEERDSLRDQLVEYGADPDHEGELEMRFDEGFADSAQTTAERARLISLIDGLRHNLQDVEHALRKIEEGSGYGICERCGKEIAIERLEALPWARLCIDCKQRVG